MKKFIIGILLVVAVITTSCFKEYDYTFNDVKVVEFETAVRTAPAGGVIYPVIALSRTSGAQRFQINLVGTHLKSSETLKISLDTVASRLLNDTTSRAIEGTHFDLKGGTVVMKADTSFARYELQIKDVPKSKGAAIFVIKLDGSDNLKPSENYRRIGFRINLN